MKKKKGLLALIILGLVLFLCSCAVAGYLMFSPSTDRGPIDYSFNTGQYTEELNELVTEGDTVLIADQSGTSLYIPSNSIDQPENISVGYEIINSADIPDFAKVHGDMIVLERELDQDFTKPVSVTVYFDNSSVQPGEIVAVYEYDTEEGIIESTTTLDYNYEAGYVTFATTHFSNYVRISIAEEKLNDALQNGFDTGFKPSEYGWYIRNWGSFETVGHCMGMSAVSKWYYNYKDKISGADLYNRYIEGVQNQEFDDVVAHELAGRVDVMLEPRFHQFKDDMAVLGYDYDGIRKLYPKLIMQNMVLTGQPEMLYIRKTSALGLTEGTTSFVDNVNHAVLAYKFKDGKLSLYDPNFPYRANGNANQNDRSVNLSYENGFGVYGSGLTSGDSTHLFNAFIPFGANFVIGNSKVKQLMSKSTERFPDDYYPVITVSSIEPISKGKVRLVGKISGDRYARSTYPKFIHAYEGDYTYDQNHPKVAVPSSGQFSLDVNVPGETYVIHLLAADATGTLSWSAYEKVTGETVTEQPTTQPIEENSNNQSSSFCSEYEPYNIPEGWLDGWACEEYDYNLRTFCANPNYFDQMDDQLVEEWWNQMNYLEGICGLEK